MPCPVRDVLFGPLVPTKKRARKWAALIACEKLFEAGALGEDLLPYRKESSQSPITEESEDGVKAKVGTRKRRRLYAAAIADELSTRQHQQISRWNLPNVPSGQERWIDQRLKVYCVQLEPSAAVLCELDILSPSICLVLLSPFPFRCDDSHVATFPLYFIGGAATTSIRCVNEVTLTGPELDTIISFHRVAVSALIGPFSTYVCSEDPQSPLNNWNFDLNESKQPILISLALTSNYQMAFDLMTSEINKAERGPALGNTPLEDWPGSIVRARHYRSSSEHIRERWIVKSVSHLTPSSPFPNLEEASTFEEYFYKRYGARSSVNNNLPLVEVCRLPTLHDYAVFRQPENISRRKHRIKKHYIMAEYCERNPLSVTAWSLIAPLPAILYRLNHLLLVYTTHSQIWGDSGPAVPVMRGPWMSKQPEIVNQLDLTDLISAFTLIEARDFQNLERLEVLGDSFLKFATSVCLLAHSETSDSEGDLSQRRGRLVSNANLYRCARHRALERCLISAPFSILSSFQPPGYVKHEQQESQISDKSLADACEALLGYTLIHGSLKETLYVLDWLCVDPGFKRSKAGIEFPAFKDPLLFQGGKEDEKNRIIDRLYDGLEKIETKINYKFKRREFLLQAMTHASCVCNRMTECYQKLEFLGDAVIDFLITKHIFHELRTKNPGELTDLRSALVNNDIFSAIVVRSGFHKHLKHSDKKTVPTNTPL